MTIQLNREDQYGSMRLMAVVEGYVMARRKGCQPFVISIKEWNEIGDINSVVSIRSVQPTTKEPE